MRRVAVLLMLLAAGACSRLSSGEAAIPVRRGDLRALVRGEGELEATQAQPIAVPRVPTGSLKVKEIVPEGSTVKPGDVVVVFDATQLRIELDNEKATLRSAQRRVDGNGLEGRIETGAIAVMKSTAQMESEHVAEFAADDPEVYSKIEMLRDQVRLTDAKETIRYADAGLLLRGQYYDIQERILGVEKGQAEGKIGRVETSMAQLVLKTPIGGMVVYKKNWRGASAGVGDSLGPGNVIMSIVDPGVVALKAYVLEKDALGVAAGAPATIVVDAWPDVEFTGTVRTIADVASPIERNSPVKYFECKIDIDRGDPARLKPGMKARARITAGEAKDALLVPRAAVGGTPDAPTLTVLGRRGRETRSVKLGTGDAVQVAVLQGVSEGESVVLGGASAKPAPGSTSAGKS